MNWQEYFRFFTITSSRYFIFAGIAFFLFYIVLRRDYTFRKIQPKYPAISDYFREIGYSILTMSLFTLVPMFLIKSPLIRPHTTFYTNIDQYGKVYFWSAFIIMFLMHDTYFYWMHRMMHHPRLFKWIHLVHHKSVNPSPWAAYSFHPLEAIVEVGILVVFLFTIPIHKFHLLFFFLFMIIYNVYGHLGFELYPKGFSKHPIGRWINTSVNHNQHHQYFKGNYGLYLLFWDRLMGTIRQDYNLKYDEVKSKEIPRSRDGSTSIS